VDWVNRDDPDFLSTAAERVGHRGKGGPPRAAFGGCRCPYSPRLPRPPAFAM